MKTLLLGIALLVASWTGSSAQERPSTIRVLASFDYPGEGNSTSARGINDQGDVTGSYDDANGITRGFIRYRDGSFSEPIVEPNDGQGFTLTSDINNRGTLAGSFLAAIGNDHGFLLSGGSFTEFDVPGRGNTDIYGCNDQEDLVGAYYETDFSFHGAYARIGGETMKIEIPRVIASYAYGINNAREVVGLYFNERTYIAHGFFRAADGTITTPIDPPGSTFTFLSGINEKGVIVGRYADENGTQHGLVLKMPHHFLAFDYPGATFTSVRGINNQNFVTGRYQDANSGLFHSYIGRIEF